MKPTSVIPGPILFKRNGHHDDGRCGRTSSRSLPEYTEESLRKLVDKIIDSQLNEGYFKMAPITFHDIQVVKDVFVDKLKTVYHSRIAYPELKTPTPTQS